MNEYLPRATLLRLLGVLAFTLAPHAGHIPLWESALVVALLLWRGASALRQWVMPPRWMRAVLAVVAFGTVYTSFGRISGQTAGVSLLVLMIGLKLTEMNARRDVMVVVLLMYFVLITHFLFSQEIWTIGYLLASSLFITASLVECNHVASPLPPRVSLRIAGTLLLHSLPVMVLLFVMFPRIPGPLWGLPSDSGAARTGLSESMSLGDISHVVQSNEVAFRVRFVGSVPPMRDRYWRGPTFSFFDGQRWRPGLDSMGARGGDLHTSGHPFDYEITLEPMRARWLFAMDMPDPGRLPADAGMGGDAEVLAREPIKERRLYALHSYTAYTLGTDLDEHARQAFTSLPRNRNPRARALAQSWRAAGMDDAAIVHAALEMFSSQPFHYTLNAPSVGADGVDDFLFKTRRGFCEHYASSFTVLMRGAGVAARIVTGYQGGEFNALGGYYVVRQSDAHAWSEVWLAGRGWVRIDPTAAVAPNRVDEGVGDALDASQGLPAYLDPRRRNSMRYRLEANWDWVNSQWDHWVLAYGPSMQSQFMRWIGLADWTRMILALTVSMTVSLTLISAWMLWRARPARPADRALQLWRRGVRGLRRRDLVPAQHEPSSDFARRVAAQEPDLAQAVVAFNEAYLAARYLAPEDPHALPQLKGALAALRARMRGRHR